MHNSDEFNIIWKESSASTNAEMKASVADFQDKTVLAVLRQTDGYGQGDHKWHSEPGANLTFSMMLKYDENHVFPASEQQMLTMATSLAVVDFLKQEGIEAAIKMPNDIYLQDRKMCGMMIENGICGKNMKWSVVGIGLNVNETDFPSDLPNPVSMAQASGRMYELEKCLRKFLRHFSIRFDAIWTEPEALKMDYENKLTSLKL